MLNVVFFCLFTRLLVLTSMMWQVESRRIKFPFIASSSPSSKKKYTPLCFFSFPKGYSKECDNLEKIVSDIEKEIGCRVERFDVARDPAAGATLALLTSRGVPFLYNRESCQTIASSKIDKSRVIAWAKGRYLSPVELKNKSTTSKNTPIVEDSSSLDQAELIKESSLTPEQLEGKRAIEERSATQAVE